MMTIHSDPSGEGRNSKQALQALSNSQERRLGEGGWYLWAPGVLRTIPSERMLSSAGPV